MIDLIAIGKTKEYVLESERGAPSIPATKNTPAIEAVLPVENPTVFVYGALDSMEKAHILAMKNSTKVEIVDGKPVITSDDSKTALLPFYVLKYALKDIKNIKEPIEFDTEDFMGIDRKVVADSYLKRIPLTVVNEVGPAIWEDNNVDEDTEKN